MAESTKTPNDDTANKGGSLLSALSGLVMPEFGKFCSISAKFVRRSEARTTKNAYGTEFRDTWKVWKVTPYQADKCIFLGVRVLKNGIRNWDDDGVVFKAKEHFKAAVVCPGPNSAPVFVPLDAVKA